MNNPICPFCNLNIYISDYLLDNARNGIPIKIICDNCNINFFCLDGSHPTNQKTKFIQMFKDSWVLISIKIPIYKNIWLHYYIPRNKFELFKYVSNMPYQEIIFYKFPENSNLFHLSLEEIKSKIITLLPFL